MLGDSGPFGRGLHISCYKFATLTYQTPCSRCLVEISGCKLYPDFTEPRWKLDLNNVLRESHAEISSAQTRTQTHPLSLLRLFSTSGTLHRQVIPKVRLLIHCHMLNTAQYFPSSTVPGYVIGHDAIYWHWTNAPNSLVIRHSTTPS